MRVNADGDAGGGTILIGGDYQGGGDMPTATNAFVGSDATITANAKTTGDGGKVIVWADDTTQFHGAIEAKGGSISGDGGLVETSGKRLLSLTGNVDASSSNGDAGSWLLDPNNVTIQDIGPDANVTASPNFTTTADSAIVTTASIESALDGGTDVTVTTSAGGVQDGDITINKNIDKTAGGDATLTLNAHNTIKIQSGADITSTSNKLNVVLNADSDNSGAGSVLIDSGSVITTNGGYIYIGGGSDVLNDGAVGTATDVEGVELNNAQLISGAGNISIRGTGLADGGNQRTGIYIRNGSKIQSTTGTITINGTGGNSVEDNYGIHINDAGTLITSASGNITLTGQGGGSSHWGVGIYLDGGADITSTGTGASAATITLNGTGANNGGINNMGVLIRDSGSTITSIDGDIDINAYSQGTAGYSYGLQIQWGATILSTGTGSNAATITLNGTGGSQGGYQRGIYTEGAYITSTDGNINITGTAGGDAYRGNWGIYMGSGTVITSNGTGSNAATITINATGGGGDYYNFGIDILDTTITSKDGNINITGNAGDTGYRNYGIRSWLGSTISSTGTGSDAATITLNGTGGNGTYENYGLYLDGSYISSVDGNINLTGQGGDGSGNNNKGILINDDADITSTGTGADAATITLNGTGGDGSGDYNHGIYLDDAGTTITSVDGNISLTGTGGVGDDENYGIKLENITINSVDGDIALTGQGGGSGTGTDNRGLDINYTTIESTGTGANAATITLSGAGGDGTFDSYGLVMDHGYIYSTDGNINIIGKGGDGPSGWNYGVYLDDTTIESKGTGANAATITLNGTGGEGDDDNDGLKIDGVTITSTDGNIILTGTGGGYGDENLGIYLDDTTIESKGTGTNAATITLNGTGGNGDDDNYGIYAEDSYINSVVGNISLTGTGNGSGDDNMGIYIDYTTIESTGTGSDAATITLNGTGANGNSDNNGIKLEGTDADILSVVGDINLTGTGAGSGTGNNGILIDDNSNIASSGSADINLTGSGTLAGSGDGLASAGTSSLGGASMTGDFNLAVDSLSLSGITIQNKGSTAIGSKTASTTIGIGDGTTGDLHVSDAELALFTTNGFTFGNSSGSGKLTVKGNTWSDDVTLRSGTGEIALSGAQTATSNDITISGGSLTGGQDITASGITIDVDGTIDTGEIAATGDATIDGGNITGSSNITANNITIDVSDGLDVGTLTSTGETTVSFDNDNSGSATVDIGAISSGGDITIADGTGSGNIVRTSGAINAGTANASIKADTINLMDVLTANIITLDATGSVTAEVSTDNVLNLAASSANLTGKINGGTGLRAALYGINSLNFTGGSSSFTFGSFNVGFDTTDISNKVQSYGKNFMAKLQSPQSIFNSFADSIDIQIDYNGKTAQVNRKSANENLSNSDEEN